MPSGRNKSVLLVVSIHPLGLQLQLTVIDKKVQQMTEKLSQTMEFSSRLFKYATIP